MRKVKLTQTRQKRFVEALSETGSVSTAAAVAGTSHPCLRTAQGRPSLCQRLGGS